MWEIYKRILKISLKDNCLFKAKVIQSIVGIININRKCLITAQRRGEMEVWCCKVFTLQVKWYNIL